MLRQILSPRWLVRPLLFLLLFILAPLLLWIIWNRSLFESFVSVREERNNKKIEVERLESQVERLRHEKSQLEAGDFALEKAARERLLLQRPNEKVVILTYPADAQKNQ